MKIVKNVIWFIIGILFIVGVVSIAWVTSKHVWHGEMVEAAANLIFLLTLFVLGLWADVKQTQLDIAKLRTEQAKANRDLAINLCKIIELGPKNS